MLLLLMGPPHGNVLVEKKLEQPALLFKLLLLTLLLVLYGSYGFSAEILFLQASNSDSSPLSSAFFTVVAAVTMTVSAFFKFRRSFIYELDILSVSITESPRISKACFFVTKRPLKRRRLSATRFRQS